MAIADGSSTVLEACFYEMWWESTHLKYLTMGERIVYSKRPTPGSFLCDWHLSRESWQRRKQENYYIASTIPSTVVSSNLGQVCVWNTLHGRDLF